VEERAHLVWRRDAVSWPTRLRPVRDYTVETQKVGSHHIYNTPHFTFRSDVRLSRDLVRAYSQVFESTHYALESLPLGLQPEAPSTGRFKVRLFRSYDDFLDAGGQLRSEGNYLLQTKEILIPLSQLGVRIFGEQVTLNEHTFDPTPLKHEITHQLMHHWLDLLPVWFAEGIAEYISAVPFIDDEFDFTRIEEGIKTHLRRKYGIRPSESGLYTVDVIAPDQLMALDHEDWAVAFGGETNAELNYRSSFLLLYFFIHLDGDGNAANLVDYLRMARYSRDQQARFVERYNRAVTKFNRRVLAYKEAAKSYNEALLRHREEAIAYNRRVDIYNEQVLSDVPPGERIDVGPEPVAPKPPDKPELPSILDENPEDQFPLNLAQIEENARVRLLGERSPDELWSHFKSALGRHEIRLRRVGPNS